MTAGDYDCPRKVLKFLTDLHAAFRMLNLRNDFLRKKFDGMLLFLTLLIDRRVFHSTLDRPHDFSTFLHPTCINHFSHAAGMKYDLRRVEEVHYDVKIRGLTANGAPVEDQGPQGPP